MKNAYQTFAGKMKSLKLDDNTANVHDMTNPKGVIQAFFEDRHFSVFKRTSSNLSFVVTI